MEPQNPRQPETDLLEALRERIKATQEAAERIAAEASAAARERTAGPVAEEANGGTQRPPASGYAVPGAASGPADTSDVQALVALIELARGIVPPELSAQLSELFREMLLLLRAVIDWYLDRLERRKTAPVEVEDIPIT